MFKGRGKDTLQACKAIKRSTQDTEMMHWSAGLVRTASLDGKAKVDLMVLAKTKKSVFQTSMPTATLLFLGKINILKGARSAGTIAIPLGSATHGTIAEITDFKSRQDHIDVTFDIQEGIEANPTIEFKKQDKGPACILINEQSLIQLNAGLEVNEDDIKLIL